jgi:hypothetical protein
MSHQECGTVQKVDIGSHVATKENHKSEQKQNRSTSGKSVKNFGSNSQKSENDFERLRSISIPEPKLKEKTSSIFEYQDRSAS